MGLWLPSVQEQLPYINLRPEANNKLETYLAIANLRDVAILNFIILSASDRDLVAGNTLRTHTSTLICLKFVRVHAGIPRAQAAQLIQVCSRLGEVCKQGKNLIFAVSAAKQA